MKAYPKSKETTTTTGARRRLYRLDPPMVRAYGTTEYVVVSSLSLAPDTRLPEALIFEANQYGKITDMDQPLIGSNRVNDSHEYALKNAGYEIAE